MTIQERACIFWARLKRRYPEPHTLLRACSPWELLVATMLAAQCTDARVNLVTPALFRRWPSPEAMADAEPSALEEAVRSTGFFRHKAKNLLATARKVRDEFGGQLPRTLAELVTLPGVARKTANVVLWGAFGINEGLAVDTHVGRISLRMRFTRFADPIRAERDLMRLFPRDEWGNVNHRMVWFGREMCRAPKPACERCEMSDFCPREGVKNKNPDPVGDTDHA
jgi:endonuclease-3